MRMLAALPAMALLLTACATSDPPPEGAAIGAAAFAYGYRCKSCHEPPVPGAPSREQMAAMKPSRIVKALTSGTMKQLALDMPESEARAIAAYLTMKP